MIDLNAELDAASDLSPPRRIITAGLDWEACMEAGGIGLVMAQTFKGSLYEPVDDGGTLLWCLPCFWGTVHPDALCDLVAWSPDDPGRWYRRTGHASLLGYDNVQRARQAVWDFGTGRADPTIELHATPKEYALAGFSGAVVLDWRNAIAELEGIANLDCHSDDNLAEAAYQALAGFRWPLPRVLVDAPKRRVA